MGLSFQDLLLALFAQTSPSAPLALSASSYLTINKHHLSYSITLTAYVKHKSACISRIYNETWGLQSNKVARRGEAHLGVQVSRSSWPFSDSPIVTTSQSRSWVDLLNFFLAGGDIAKFGIGHDDRETSTQGALRPDEQLCSIEDPTFHCKFSRYRHFYVLHML
ncbi:predicted protein [Lichtheimia corymbifera JMRC:FSU:9682]|uniref:Uncharacterized protein n=1 Tax=Lichtheimia corymbifera JMRC:FSU:9682 TaxID=1263082 RepID=A0A068S3T6_9FUNG|nr:predicted protein [Lichtheimia corymbifera JMRC:FSU:9682]